MIDQIYSPGGGSATFGFAYGRVSSVGTGAGGTSRQEQSIEVQDATFREYLAEIRVSEDCIQFFQERGSGAFTKEDIRHRREGAKMWAAIVQCRALYPAAEIHLLLTKVDRLGRGFLATQIMFQELRQMRIRIHILNLGGKSFDCDSLMGQKMLADLAFFSQFEVAATRERIMGTINYKFDRHQLCGETPYGFTTRETGEVTGKGVRIRELVDNPAEQKWILHMITMRRDGHTDYAIAKDLNLRRIPTKKAGTIARVHTGVDEHGVATVDSKVVRNRWTPGKVEKILASKTINQWLQSRSQSETVETVTAK